MHPGPRGVAALKLAILIPARMEINTVVADADPWRVSLPLKPVRGTSFRITGGQQGRRENESILTSPRPVVPSLATHYLGYLDCWCPRCHLWRFSFDLSKDEG